ncbi:MAG TPA: DNA-binding domain-containing protein [Myxococcales bacterium]|nr:DNA-binding domain-containing protein [Myxococcales bacterium]
MKLAEMQRLFYQLASRAPGSESIDPAALLSGTAGLDPKARVGIYADMFIWRQVDALRDDFPKLALLLGDGSFYVMAEEYLRAHPSRHASLSELGRELPQFLSRWSGEGARADLADLAALEWARAKVFEEANVASAPAEQLRTLAGDVLPGLRLRFVPALRVLALEHDVTPLWEDGARPGPPSPRNEQVAVWRKDFEVLHAPIDADEARALELARAGEPLGVVCEAFAERPDAVEAAFRAISSWFAEGWIRAEGAP